VRPVGDLLQVFTERIKALEATTHHDVKAVEYWLREKFAAISLVDVVEWIHFGLTSEDVNQTAWATALRDSRDAVLLPVLDTLCQQLRSLAETYKATPMLAWTHGQPAVPTTLGKEFAVFYTRLKKQRALLSEYRFEGKLSGSVGNFNALVVAEAKVDWLAFSERFIHALGLEPKGQY